MDIFVDKNWCFKYKEHMFRLYGLYDSKQADICTFICYEVEFWSGTNSIEYKKDIELTNDIFVEFVSLVPDYYTFAQDMYAGLRLPEFTSDVLDRYLEATE